MSAQIKGSTSITVVQLVDPVPSPLLESPRLSMRLAKEHLTLHSCHGAKIVVFSAILWLGLGGCMAGGSIGLTLHC